MDDLIEIQYVGRKPRKKDTVAGTGIIWHGRGDVQLVPRAVAQRLCDYPDIWRRALPMAHGSGAGGLMGVDAAAVPAPDYTEIPPQGPAAPGQNESPAPGAEIAAQPTDVPCPQGEAETGPDEVVDVPTPMHARLVDVIRNLPPDGFTEAGRPRKSSVVAILGEDVSVADIASAWDDVQAVKAAQEEVQ